MMEISNILVRRDYLKNKQLMAENDVRNVYFYWKLCVAYETFYAIRNELTNKDFNSFNKYVPFWNVYKDPFRIEPLPLNS